ncbi:hypothetical protein PBRA_003714 [Plasmodiophora brassicae]|nr:hypothetical protein PBRA_003714 [Plasmodiophora brassicae]
MRKAVAAEEPSLDPNKYVKFKLKEKTIITHNTRRFRFALKSKNVILGLPVGKHILLQAQIDGVTVCRPYTPTSSNDDVGYFDIVVKVYDNGKMSQHLDKLAIGDSIEVKGPQGRFAYLGLGQYDMGPRGHGTATHIGMLAGGTGITPMLQVIKSIMRDPNDKTQMSLIFGNIEERDILLREELQAIQESRSSFKVHHTLNTPPEEWKHGRGYITSGMIKAHMPPPAKSTLILICGPKPFVDAMIPLLDQLGYTAAMMYKF